MKTCIFGAGAIGGFYGCELARAGQDVTLIARGAHLAAMQENGVTIRMHDGTERHARPFCTDNPAEAGVQDIVIFVVKAHQLEEAAKQAQPLLGPDTVIVAAQNGIPWWYGYREGGKLDGKTLNAVDPGGRIAKLLGPERTLGGMINGSCSIAEPGVIFHPPRQRLLTVGEPAGGDSNRCQMVVELFSDTDTRIEIAKDMRETVWEKIMSNIGGSMVCVLTRSPMGRMNSDPACMALVGEILRDANKVSARLGYDFGEYIIERSTPKPSTSPHKPSTLQDLEAGKPMEIDAIVGAVAEIGRTIGRPTPIIDVLYGVVRRLAEESGCYPENDGFALGAPVSEPT